MNSTTEKDSNYPSKIITVLNRKSYEYSDFEKQPEETILMLEAKAKNFNAKKLTGVKLSQIKDIDGKNIMMGYGTIIT